MDGSPMGGRAVRWLYVRYVRLPYLEQEHPVRYNAVMAVFLTAILWPVFVAMNRVINQSVIAAFDQAAIYAVVFCGLRAWRVPRPNARWRFERWAAKHPTPEELSDPVLVNMVLERRPLPRGMALGSWIGWTVLASFFVAFCVGMVFTVFSADSGRPGTVQDIAIPALGVVGGVLLRNFWPPIRDWGRRRDAGGST
jgi:hypothetical protein